MTIQAVLEVAVSVVSLLGFVSLICIAFSDKARTRKFFFYLGILAFVLVLIHALNNAARIMSLPSSVSLQSVVSNPKLFYDPIYLIIWVVVGGLSFRSYGHECIEEGFRRGKAGQ